MPFFSAEAASVGKEAKKELKAVHLSIGERAVSGNGINLELKRRFQGFNRKPKEPGDVYDEHIHSPKSAFYSAATGQIYVNSLEGMATVVYDAGTLTKKTAIVHRFGSGEKGLFRNAAEGEIDFGKELAENRPFYGKPVEFAETHGGRYVWVSYYRRSYDVNALLPSAVAAIDTQDNRIVRVFNTAPLPKSLAASPDGRWLAVIHWGNNSIGFIDVKGDDPAGFRYVSIVPVEKRYTPSKGEGDLDRDSDCGLCLRGGVFTPNSRYFLTGRMKGGGVAMIDVEKMTYVGTLYGMRPTPRHLVLSPDGKRLYISSNYSGYVSVYPVEEMVKGVLAGKRELKPEREVRTGPGTRTIDLSPDGRYLFAAIKNSSSIAVFDAADLAPVMNFPVDSFPVGLEVAEGGRQLWVTSQGIDGVGGHSVTVFEITYSGH